MTIKAGVDFTKTIRDGKFEFFLMSHYAYVKLHHVLQFRKEKTKKHNKYFLQMLCKNNVFGDAIVL